MAIGYGRSGGGDEEGRFGEKDRGCLRPCPHVNGWARETWIWAGILGYQLHVSHKTHAGQKSV